MKTYHYCETNGNATIVVSANTNAEAIKYINEIVKYSSEWRFEFYER